MPRTQAMVGYNSKFYLGSSDGASPNYTELQEVVSIEGLGYSTDSVDASHMQSPEAFREFLPGMTDAGEASLEVNYVPGSDTEQVLDELFDLPPASRTRRWKIEYPNGVTKTFLGFITSMSTNAPLDDKLSMSLTVKATGRPAIAGNDSPIP